MCGEQIVRKPIRFLPYGSSPRVRGTEYMADIQIFTGRFIPACAGNSLTGNKQMKMYPVHPRVCGEQGKEAERKPIYYGSSPRVRGTENNFGYLVEKRRFIPACAGNRNPLPHNSASFSVHPRVCGEQLFYPNNSERNFGSSPRVRGTDESGLMKWPGFRFIPACAGNS